MSLLRRPRVATARTCHPCISPTFSAVVPLTPMLSLVHFHELNPVWTAACHTSERQ